MERIVVLGPGGAGKSTFARALSARTGIPVTELDTVFWSADLQPTAGDEWAMRQVSLCAEPRWILDGDLGPHDRLDARLRHADAVVVLDLSPWRCAWRAMRRSRNRLDFWIWLLTWRRRHRPRIERAIAEHAPRAAVLTARRPEDVERLLDRWPG